MNHLWKSLVTGLLICCMVVAMIPATAFAASNTGITEWDKVDGDRFKVVTTKKNATVTVEVRKVKNHGIYPQDAISVKFVPSGTAKTVTAKTGWYLLRPSDGAKSYTIKFPKAGSYWVDVEIASGMDRFLSGGEVEWRVKKCSKYASVK